MSGQGIRTILLGQVQIYLGHQESKVNIASNNIS